MINFEPKNWALFHTIAKKYLERPQFDGTPITADMLTDAAKRTHDRTGVYIPVELALSQAQIETSMGKTGRNPDKNPYNVGEFDFGTNKTFKNTQAGVQAYMDLMASHYLLSSSPEALIKNFVSKDGLRYASDPDYERKLEEQCLFIQRHFMGAWLR